MGQVKDVNYFSIKDDCAEEQEQPHACCDYLVEVIQLDEDQQQVKVKFNFSELNMIAPVFIPIEFTSLATEIEASASYPLAESPPIYKRPIYQLNCSFTYYG